jgi:hypothetical protein
VHDHAGQKLGQVEGRGHIAEQTRAPKSAGFVVFFSETEAVSFADG